MYEIGARIGRLVVLDKDVQKQGYLICICDCGTIKSIRSSNLVRFIQSCGCLSKELRSQCAKTHGKSQTPEYRTWCAIKERCDNATSSSYHNYGGRGIKICDTWKHSFETFLKDVGKKPTPQHSIDRINNNGHYEPSNVRWATPKQQSRNNRRNRIIEYKDNKMTIIDAAEAFGLTWSCLHQRIIAGWSVERALETPVKKRS